MNLAPVFGSTSLISKFFSDMPLIVVINSHLFFPLFSISAHLLGKHSAAQSSRPQEKMRSRDVMCESLRFLFPRSRITANTFKDDAAILQRARDHFNKIYALFDIQELLSLIFVNQFFRNFSRKWYYNADNVFSKVATNTDFCKLPQCVTVGILRRNDSYVHAAYRAVSKTAPKTKRTFYQSVECTKLYICT